MLLLYFEIYHFETLQGKQKVSASKVSDYRSPKIMIVKNGRAVILRQQIIMHNCKSRDNL